MKKQTFKWLVIGALILIVTYKETWETTTIKG